jgi:hypothetical protein
LILELNPYITEKQSIFWNILAIPTPAMAASLPRCPANDTFTTCTINDDSIETMLGIPIFVICLIASV